MAKTVEPGDVLATSEEFLPGEGIYDDGEHLRAASFGEEHVDAKDMKIHVRGKSRVASIEKGDIIVGRVSYNKTDLASVTILAIRGKEDRSFHTQVEGTLHVSKVDNRYIGDMSDEIRVGDIIRARVLDLKGGPQLTTEGPDLGVLRAFSPENALQPMVRDGWDAVIDPISGAKFRRKLASDYGSGRI